MTNKSGYPQQRKHCRKEECLATQPGSYNVNTRGYHTPRCTPEAQVGTPVCFVFRSVFVSLGTNTRQIRHTRARTHAHTRSLSGMAGLPNMGSDTYPMMPEPIQAQSPLAQWGQGGAWLAQVRAPTVLPPWALSEL